MLFRSLLPDHGHLMHLYVIRQPEMDAVYHLHPSRLDEGHLAMTLPTMPPGKYKLYADIVHANGFPETLTANLTVPPGLAPSPLAAEDASALPPALSAGMLGAEYKLPHSHAARVKSGDKGRHGPGWHKSTGPIDITHHLRHRLAHIRAFVEFYFEDRSALNTPGLYILYPRNVEEMILIIGGDKTFHLLRRQPPIRLGDIHGRQPQLWENIYFGMADGKPGEKDDGQDGDQHRDGMTQR